MERDKRLEKGWLKIGEVAEMTGVLPSTVRYYTDIGLLEVSAYTPGGYRLYERKRTMEKMSMIKQMNSTKPSLREIKTYLATWEMNTGEIN